MASTTKSSGLLRSLWIMASAKPIDYAEPTEANVLYREGEIPRGIKPRADIYLPTPERATGASVILFHGGGFCVGNKGMKPMKVVATRLVEAGIAVFVPDYRMILRGGRFNECQDDAHAASKYWIERCESLGCDLDRVSVMGLSAGAVLALMHASHSEFPYRKVVNVYAATDFSEVAGARARLILKMLHGSTDKQHLKKNSPLYAPAIQAPVLTLHGTADEIVPISHSESYHADRQAKNLPSEFHVFEGMHHGYLVNWDLEETRRSLRLVTDFLRS